MTQHTDTDTDADTDADAARRPRSPRGEGDSLRDELLDAAEALLIDHGSMEAVSIRAIVRAVGVSPPSLYLHFDDKDDLFFEVCLRRFADFEQALREASDGIDDPVERLHALGQAYVRFGVTRREHYGIIFGPGAQDVVRDRDLSDAPSMRAFALLVGTIQECIDTGAICSDDAWLTSMTLWSAVHGAVMLYLTKDKLGDQFPLPDPEVLGAHVLEVVLHGLAPR
jgi:AcrR family transcriptional regulator